MKVPSYAIDGFRRVLRPGLVLNMSTRSLAGKLIRRVLAARDPISRFECPNHDSICVEWDGALWIGESQPPVARLTPVEQYEREMESGFIYRLRVLEVVDASQAEELAAARWWLDHVRNAPYNYLAFPRLLFKALVGDWWQKAAGLEWSKWCTEGVADAWRKGAGVDPWRKVNPTPLTTWKRNREGGFRKKWEWVYGLAE